MKRTISVLGSSGSIGRQTLKVASACGYQVAAVTVNRSVEQAEAQARQFKPKLAGAGGGKTAAGLRGPLAETGGKSGCRQTQAQGPGHKGGGKLTQFHVMRPPFFGPGARLSFLDDGRMKKFPACRENLSEKSKICS